ncbi:AAA family ATPase [Roseomonas frigidaquae]|uniref:AAA family ATPase n=1 Tax=Falsiroseomonas frigidaquae TaxID=487318 RepID=A0ABX1F876_9PROT|nr:winged helix-turn-helix domain-containing protein [Falsiroseomonas frigidaquae]NKE48588.1 AAA family ATPase [Falsiroseomonas frigidaquae]
MEPGSVDAEERIYRFGDFRLLPARQSLLRGDTPVRIGSRAIDLLRLLVERPGQLLSKAELISSAWPDTFVHENNLKVNIAALRRALGDTASDLPYIATVTGRGYRFVATVRVQQAAPGRTTPTEFPGAAAGMPPPAGIVGRDEDITRIAETLAWRRFLTIVGPAGVGKTTVALAAARHAASHQPDGVCFVDLAAIGDPQLVTVAIASAIGAGGNLKDILAGIVDALRGRRQLLILDNCEHVLRAASVVADHIRAALPDIAVLATSREPFRSRGETVYRLPPLSCPGSGEDIGHDQAMAFTAVQLFVARARAASGFRLTDANAPIVAGICRRLDGIPLAIELAAPRLRGYDAGTLLHLLDQSFDLLSYGPAEAPLRQQTLLATLDWSYRLLSEAEAAVLRFLSVFAGAFMLDDAIGVGRNLARPPEEIASCIEGLVAKSLLSSSFAGGMLQYRLLDATRSYAAERLRGAGEQRCACTAHATHLLMLFERAEAELQWRVHEEWTVAYGRLANDLRRALDWAFGAEGEPVLGVRLTACAIALWDEMSSVGEGSQRVRRALQSPALAEGGLAARMKLMTAHAWSLSYTERFAPGGEALWQESLRLAELAGDQDYQVRSALGLVVLQCFYGQHRETLKSLRRFQAIAGENDSSAVPAGERMRVMTEFFMGDVRGAHEELKRLVRRDDSTVRRSRLARFQFDWCVAIRTSLGVVQWVAGQPHEAAATVQAALDRATEIGHLVSHSTALVLAAIPVALWTGQIDVAERRLACLVANLRQCDIIIWEPAARLFEGMIQQERGDTEGVQRMQTALTDMMATHFLGRMPNFLCMLADAALRHGRLDIARESMATALDMVERNEERWCEPEVLRVRGILQWREGDARGGEASLLRAAKLAAQSGAMMFELRAALALASCWAAEGRTAEAHALLGPVCARFDAAADGRDVAQARQLLDRLGRSDRRNLHVGRTASGTRLRRSDA